MTKIDKNGSAYFIPFAIQNIWYQMWVRRYDFNLITSTSGSSIICPVFTLRSD